MFYGKQAGLIFAWQYRNKLPQSSLHIILKQQQQRQNNSSLIDCIVLAGLSFNG